MPRHEDQSSRRAPDPVELLLQRAVRRSLSRSRSTGRGLQVVACRGEGNRGSEGACVGRRPEGLLSEGVQSGRSRLGDFLARCAHLEAASVFSFSRLARELEAHGAPKHLIARAHQARADEVRHASVVGALARDRGGELSPVEISSLHVRSLEEMALENAVEGCVLETYGAAIGAHQAECAEDLGIRSALVEIARDEARHASLSHAVHAWAWTKLSPEARKRIEVAQTRAIRKLSNELVQPLDCELQRAAGLPSVPVARRLVTELMETLWSGSHFVAQSAAS